MIQINKRWGIRSNNRAVCLCKSIKVKGEIRWEDQHFFVDVPQALEKLVSLSILRGLDKGSWKDVMDELKLLRVEIRAIKDELYREI